MLPFDPAIYADRLKHIQNHLKQRQVSGILLFDPENIFWLTGYQTIGYFTFHTLFVGVDGELVVIGRVVNRDLALACPTISEFVSIVDTDEPHTVLTGWLNNRLLSNETLALETAARNFTARDYLAITELLHSRVIECNGIIESQRMIKSDAELASMRHAARAAEAGLQAAIEAVAPGKTENDVAAAMFAANIAAGSEYLGHPPLVVAGETTSLCFAMWQRRTIQKNDVVLLEAAGCINRYHAMLSRPVVAGKASSQHREAADALQGVLESAIAAIQPGLTAGEVDAACRAVVEERGLGSYFRHRSAYGIGLGFPPNWSEGHIYAIRPDDPLVLQPGMTFHVIPTLFLEGFGMCFSDSVVVTESGCELLTRFERRLFEI